MSLSSGSIGRGRRNRSSNPVGTAAGPGPSLEPERNLTLTDVEPLPAEIASENEWEFSESELVFGIVCAVGTDYSHVVNYLSDLIRRYRYKPKQIHLSEHLKHYSNAPLGASTELERIKTRMDAGNELRKDAGRNDILALAAIAEIQRTRKSSKKNPGKIAPFPEKRCVHILTSLKRTEEVVTLRKIYGAGFFLIGIFSDEAERLDYLVKQKNIDDIAAKELVARDIDEDHPNGQRTRETFSLSDVFVTTRDSGFKAQIHRFLELIFGHPFITPHPDEYAMFIAYAAALRSSQLGRQVGASIVSRAGDIVSVGCNEVPKAGGGAYWPTDIHDARDHTKKADSNDDRKLAILDNIFEILREHDLIDHKAKIDPQLFKNSLLFDITEFGRAVHAEMDAILSCGRSGVATIGGRLFTTTFPCHNCTRHIVSAGLKQVVYIEPYPKSLAEKLHADAIQLGRDAPENSGPADNAKVDFVPFVGIGPRRFFDLFSMNIGSGRPIKRKNRKGEVIQWSAETSFPRVPMLPTSYLERELLAVRCLDNSTRRPSPANRKEGRSTKWKGI